MNRPESKTILFVANSSWNLANFRAPIIAALKDKGYKVAAVVPDDDGAARLRESGVEVHPVDVDARGLSPLRDSRLLIDYFKRLRRIRPAAMFAFTIKPNIYASIAAAKLGIPVINTISGLGTGFLSSSLLKALVTRLYRGALGSSKRVFFHNEEDRDLFVEHGIVSAAQAAVVAGSGVDLSHFQPVERSGDEHSPVFLFIGRLLTDKGAVEFAEAASIVRKSRESSFRMLGALDNHPKAAPRDVMHAHAADCTVELLGPAEDVRPYIAEADCIVLPSYREGLPRVLLEAAAMATPVIATDVPGCRQAVEDRVTGLLCQARSADSLARAMADFADMPCGRRMAMGKAARAKAEREFSEAGVVAAYLDELRKSGI